MNQSCGRDRVIDTPGCLRRPTNFERYMLWSAENNMAAVVRILGVVHEDDLRRAIDSISALHPLMGARIIIDSHHDMWFSTDHAQKAPLRAVPRTSEEQWFEEIQQEYLVPFEPERGPMIRFVLIFQEDLGVYRLCPA